MFRIIRVFLEKIRRHFHLRSQKQNNMNLKRPSRNEMAAANSKTQMRLYVSGERALDLAQRAQAYSQARDYKKAKACASEAIQINPSLVDAFAVRALACRVLGELDMAIADYTKVIEIDPNNSQAWMFRGACKTQKASNLEGLEKTTLINEAHPDYQRAAELRPDDELAGLALLELEICIGKYREAVGTAGVWWNRVRTPANKVICAWLGVIAMILAVHPERKWAHLKAFLEQDRTRLGPTDWCVTEIEGCLKSVQGNPSQAALLDTIRPIHASFIKRFSGGGPALK